MQLAGRKYDKICPGLTRPYGQGEFNRYFSLGVLILANKRLRDFLPDILFWRFNPLRETVDEV